MSGERLAREAQRDQFEAAAAESRRAVENVEAAFGLHRRDGATIPWLDGTRTEIGCPHLGSPRPVLSWIGRPGLIYCVACFPGAPVELDGRCDLCAEPGTTFRPIVLSTPPLTILGDVCEGCFTSRLGGEVP